MRLLFTLMALLLWPGQAQARSQHIAVSLVASTEEPRPGSTLTLGFRFQPQAGWHGYWSNPGDSGLAPQVEWKAPTGLKFGPLQHPAPTILRVAGINSYVHAGEHVLLSRVRIPASIAPGSKLPITASLNWLACSDSLCVPERATVSIELTAGDGSAGSKATVIRKAQGFLPQIIGAIGSYAPNGGNLRFTLPPGVRLDASRARIFPDSNGFLDASTTRFAPGEGGGELIAAASGSPPSQISGVLADGERAYRIRFTRGLPSSASMNRPGEKASQLASLSTGGQFTGEPAEEAPAGVRATVRDRDEAPALATTQAAASPSGMAAVLLAVLGAIAGGLLLNLMPCVFPILSLKALSLARSGSSEREARREALGYTAGALLGTGLLGLAIMILRQAGVEVGWSFQLQNPAVILSLLLLTFGIALNFAGLFELPSLSLKLRGRDHRLSGSVATGALAAFIATPCSGPFMAAALGAAMFLPVSGALLVFLSLGLGLALPFLLIAFFPATRHVLPKPGPWLATFRRVLAIPMLITAVALLWLVGRQGGTEAMVVAVLLALVLGVALWWVGLRQRGSRECTWLRLATIGAALALMALAAPPRMTAASVPAETSRTEPFSTARLSQLRREGRPIFVDFTADWCLTCKVNEKIAIDRTATQKAFRRAGIVTLEGDWTQGDPAITRFLASHGRNSIPFYLHYPPGQQPQVLPQILTPELLQVLASSVRQS